MCPDDTRSQYHLEVVNEVPGAVLGRDNAWRQAH